MRPSARLALALCVPVIALAPAAAGDSPPAAEPVRVTIEIGKIEKGNKTSATSYELVGFAGGQRLQLTSGLRVPIPSGAPSETKDGVAPAVSFTYQNVGVSATLEVDRFLAQQFRVTGKIDASVLRTPEQQVAAGAPPVIGTLSYDFDILARPGKTVRAVMADEPPVGQVYVDVKLDLLD